MLVKRHRIDIRIRRVNDNAYGDGFCDIQCDYLLDNEKKKRFECMLFDVILELVPEIPGISRTICCDQCDSLCEGVTCRKTTEEEISLFFPLAAAHVPYAPNCFVKYYVYYPGSIPSSRVVICTLQGISFTPSTLSALLLPHFRFISC